MPDNNNGNPMNNGAGRGNNGVDIASIIYEIFQHLDKNTKSYTDQLKVLVREIKSVSRSDSKSGTNSSTSGFSGRRRTFDYDDIYDDAKDISEMFKRLHKDIRADHKELLSSSEDFKRDLSKLDVKDLETILTKKQLEIAKKYADLQENALKHYEQAITEIESRSLTETEKDTLNKLKRKKELAEKFYNKSLQEEEKYTEEQKSRYKKVLEKTTKELENYTEQLAPKTDKGKKEAAEKVRKKYEEEQRELNEKERAEKASVEPIKAEFDKESVKEALGAIESLKSQSPYLNEKLDDGKTDFEKFEENRQAQLKLLERAGKTLDAYEEKIRQDRANGNITEEELQEQLETINKQKKNIEDAKKAIEGWSPVKDALSQAGKDLTSYAKNMIKNIAKFGLEKLEDKYLTAYKEGFEKVYQSVENTRNQISARSKLDQGAFSDMQSEIQDQIEQQGLETVVSQADVNEALISLSSAGITDKELLKTLALEQAKLSASGSSLKLDNEETLQRFQEYIGSESAKGRSYEDILSDIPNLMSEIMNYEGQIRDDFGNDIASMGGNLNKIFNEVLDVTNTAGKNFSEASKDIGAAMTYGQAQFNMGLDPDTLMASIRDLTKGSASELSNFGKILYEKGITGESLRSGEVSIQDALSATADELEEALANKNTTYIKEIMDAYGISSMDPNQAVKFLRMGGLGDVKVAGRQELDAQQAQRDAANKAGTYYSATQNHQKKAENKMAEIANTAEQLYKGDEFVQEGFKEVSGLLGVINDSIINIGESFWKQNGGNALGQYVRNNGGAGQVASDFLTGAKGTTAGAVGKGVGAAVGAGMVGYSVVSHIADREGGEPALETINDIAQDSTTWAGIGTAVGSAVGGPIAGAVVGALMGTAGEWGGKLGDYIATKMDPFQEAVAEFKKTSEQQLLDSKTNLEETKKSLATYEGILKKNDKGEMKKLLMEKANISASDLRNADDERIQKLFEDNIVKQASNLEKEAEQQVALDQIINKNAQSLVNIEDMFGGLAQAETGTAFEDMTSEEQESYKKKLLEGSYGNTFRGQSRELLGDVGKRIDELQSMSDDEISNYLVRSGVFSASEIKSMDEAKKKEAVTTAVTKEFENMGQMSAETAIVFENEVSKMADRKKIYEKSEEELQKRWDNTKRNLEELGEDINETNMVAEYIKLYHPMDDIGNFNSDVTSDIILNSDGTVSLNPGIDYKNSYRFESGLTEVPYDEYPALLHKGERILTKEEAEAYNMISSNAIQQYFGRTNSLINDSSIYDSLSSYILTNLEDNIYNNSSSSVLSTRQYGTDNVEQSINNQTTSLSEILNQILEVIKNLNLTIMSVGQSGMSKSRYNVLRGNSSIAQINTL